MAVGIGTALAAGAVIMACTENIKAACVLATIAWIVFVKAV